MARVTIALAGRAPLADPLRLSRIDRDIRFAPDNASIPALSGPPCYAGSLRRILGKKTRWLKRPSGKSREETPLGGLWTARTPKTCLLLPDAVLRVFRETNTISRNTRRVLNAADVARATAFNLVQAAEAV